MRRLGGLLTRWEESSLYALLFLLPFSKAAVEIGFGLLLLGWTLRRLDPATRAESVWRSPGLRHLLVAAAGFLAACAVSIGVSGHPALSLRGFFSKWLEYLLLFVIVADLGHRPGVVKRSLAVVACSSVFVAIEALTQEVARRGLFRGYPLIMYDRMTGPYENPGDLATYLMVIVPILLAFSLGLRTAWRRWVWALTAALVLCLARVNSLGAWLGLAAGLLAAVVVSGRFRWAALMGLAAAGLTAAVFLHRPGQVLSWLGSDVGAVDRLVMWQAALGMIRDRPILGHGLNTFMANYLDYWVGGERMPRYAHNCYLQVAAETGLIGLAAFLWLLAALLGRLGRAIRDLPPEERLWLSGLWAGLVAFAVQAAVDTNFYALRQAALFWALAGLATGLSERGARVASPPPSGGR